MALNVEKILKHIGGSLEELSELVNISVEDLKELETGNRKLTDKELISIMSKTHLLPEEIISDYTGAKEDKVIYEPSYTWSPSKKAQNDLKEYISEGTRFFKRKDVKKSIQLIDECIASLRKPKISFAGQTDTGKSTMINCLLGGENLPTHWTPTTSIAVYIKHIDDKPEFMTEPVWIFANDGNEIWDELRCNEQEYCERLVIAKGDLELLGTFGTHQGGQAENATAAVVYIESPILKNCDIVDLPGFAASEKGDDAIHYFVAKGGKAQLVDILIYLSRANGFLQSNDIYYLNTCLNVLKPIEKKGRNDIKKLGNLFIVAAQANTVENGNVETLTQIMDQQCKALCRPMYEAAMNHDLHSYLPMRSRVTGYAYGKDEFRARFFTYEKDSKRLCKNFHTDLMGLIELIPDVYFNEFVDALNKKVEYCSSSTTKKIDEFLMAIEEQEEYRKLYDEICNKEPARKVQTEELKREIINKIKDYKTDNKRVFSKHFDEYMTKENLLQIIENQGLTYKKEDQNLFQNIVYTDIQMYCEKIVQEKSDAYSKEVNKYLDFFEESTLRGIKKSKVKLCFDVKDVFATATIGFGILGASASWLATFGASFVGAYFIESVIGMAPLLAMIGTIGGIIAAAVLVILTIISFTVTWKNDLVRNTINQYKKKNVKEEVLSGIEKYWNDTKDSFIYASEEVEREWREKIVIMERTCQEANIPELKKDLKELKAAFDFFEKMPLPEKR